MEDHSALGTKISQRFCHRHKINKKDSSLIEWLVENHLRMSITSQKEDLTNPRIIHNFVKEVETETKLNYLYCLTVADISATNPNLWNSWNETLLNDLYFKTLKVINSSVEISKYSKSQVEKMLFSIPKSSQVKIKELWKNLYPNYFESHSPGLILNHSLLISERKFQTVARFIPSENSMSSDSLLVYTKDRVNVLGTIVGELDAQNINVLEARLYLSLIHI